MPNFRCEVCSRHMFEGQCHNPGCSRYLTGKRLKFKAGSFVFVKKYEREGFRKVELVYTDIEGGRRLCMPVHGNVSWNVQDLRLATVRERRRLSK